jgi:hypothetical protein
MLGDVQAINAGGFRRFGETQSLVEQLRQRPIAVLDMIEKSNPHLILY